jgi:hypothetical protein
LQECDGSAKKASIKPQQSNQFTIVYPAVRVPLPGYIDSTPDTSFGEELVPGVVEKGAETGGLERDFPSVL